MKKIINKRNVIGFLMGLFISSGVVFGVDYLFASQEISYDNTDSGMNATNVKSALDELYACANGEGPVDVTLKVGDYVQMTPTLTSYTTDVHMTGFSTTQTINPSELNLWRVIRVNADGTYDAVSDKVSSVNVYFEGKTGYQNFIYYLNVLASKYENRNYTVGSRYMGYNGQTEFISDTHCFDGTQNNACWTSSTSGTPAEEYLGRGDELYTTDTNLVNSVYGTLVAQKIGTSTATIYFLGSRYYYYGDYGGTTDFNFRGRLINASGSIVDGDHLRRYYNSWLNYSRAYPLRPIIVLSSDLQASGTGTESDPYVLYDPNYNQYSMAAMCPGCVFAKYTSGHYIQSTGKTPNTLSDVTTTSDYTTLNSNYFLGHILENGYITRSFACGIEDTGTFCLEGYDRSKYSNNIDILNHFFPSCNASSSGTYASCSASLDYAYADSYGGVNVRGTSSSYCRVNANYNGDAFCN